MDIAKRFVQNPLIRPSDIKPGIDGMEIVCLLNPGVFLFQGKIWLLLRVAERPKQIEGKISVPLCNREGNIEILSFDNNDPDLNASDTRIINYKKKDYLTTLSYFRPVCSDDGVNFYEPDGYPSIFGKGEMESFGIEDCRIASMKDEFCLSFTEVSEFGVGVGLIRTTDWKNFHREGMIFPPHNKDCAIFDEKINGMYFALHRPSSPELGGNYIWLAESPDLLHWGRHKCVATVRPGMWDSERVGAGAAPIRTEKGWLAIYHGANKDQRYCLGALLLDINNPSKVLARSIEPIMEPTQFYENSGFFGNVIFSNGHYVKDDDIFLYYGASDQVICGARFSIAEIFESLNV